MTRSILALSICLLFSSPSLAAIALNADVQPSTIHETICVPGYSKDVRPSVTYTNGVKAKLLRKHGLAESHMTEFELDHIVPLALGGHPRSLDNLMLQPWPEAKRKDRLEKKLQCLVCTGQVGLAEAQRDLYEDWEAAYHGYAKVRCQKRYEGPH